MHILIGIIGIIFFWHLHFCLALTEKYIRQYVGILLVIQLVFAFILLKTTNRYYSYWGHFGRI